MPTYRSIQRFCRVESRINWLVESGFAGRLLAGTIGFLNRLEDQEMLIAALSLPDA